MINTIITDFDGTLVDTFEANYKSYQKAFSDCGFELSVEKYRECFGYRFDSFMTAMGISDDSVAKAIREAKKEYYTQFFDYLKPNKSLIELIAGFKAMGGKTAIASTARKENLMNVVKYLEVEDIFDLIISGVDVKEGKPSPEIYLTAMQALNSKPGETLIFEDSEVGIQAAKASGAFCSIISPAQFP